MQFMNVGLSNLRGRHHPCLSNIISSKEVKKLRPHIKFLTGDYLTYERKYEESGQDSPICKICKSENESISHILTHLFTQNTRHQEKSEIRVSRNL